MSNPQGSTFDTAYIDSLTKQVEGISVCEDLQKFSSEVMADVQAQLSAMEKQLEALSPIADLLTAPGADLEKIVTWISDFISGVLKPMYQPYVTITAQIAQTTAAVARLETAIENKAAEITSCAVSIPSVVASSAQ